jgi:hypothetical protein
MLRRGDETGGVGGSSADGGEVIETLSLPVETLVADIKARADLTPLGQVAAEEGARAGKRKAACQDQAAEGGSSSNQAEPTAGGQLGDGPKWNLTKAVERSTSAEERGHDVGTLTNLVTAMLKTAMSSGHPEEVVFHLENGTRCIGSRNGWIMPASSDKSEGDGQTLSLLAAAMLKEALTCGKHADMHFQFQDAELVGGHVGILSALCAELRVMFDSGMREATGGKVYIPGVGASAVKGLLEWVYLGEWKGVIVVVPTDW